MSSRHGINVVFFKDNLTREFLDLSTSKEDQFAGVFEDIYVKIILFFAAIWGYCCIPVMVMIIRFERGGEAGHYRTLINQIVSCVLDQVCFSTGMYEPLLILFYYQRQFCTLRRNTQSIFYGFYLDPFHQSFVTLVISSNSL